MATREIKSQRLNEINERLQGILGFNIDKDLIRTEDLGNQLNFIECKEFFDKIMNISTELKDGDIKDLPFNKIDVLAGQTNVILKKFNEIKNFDPKTQSGNREGLITQISDSYENYYLQTFEILNFVKLNKFKLSDIESDVKSKLTVMTNMLKEADQKLNEINEILNKSKQAAGKIGVAKYSTYFSEEAGDHDLVSKRWFCAVISMGALTAVWGIFLLFWIRTELTTGEAIQYSIAKFIVLSVLFYGLVWTTKNYNAHRHNSIVNKHRSNSLNSFETFVKSTDDPATKDAVLLQATQSIFSPQSSGYDSKDGESDPSNKFIEILRHIEPKNK